METVVDTCLKIKDESKIALFYLITNKAEVVDEIVTSIEDIPLIVATSDSGLQKLLREKEIRMIKISKSLLYGIDVLDQTKDLLISACSEGLMRRGDKVLCLISTDIDAYLSFDVADIGIASISENIKDRVDVKVFETAFSIASQIAREGREGKPTGALFVVGDSENVLKSSRALINNPFEGHDKEGRCILEEKNTATIKEFALLDGAVIIDNDGCAIAAGRYIMNISFELYLAGGLGGRHLAGASISKTTKTISIVVSSTGTITVFMDGNEIYKVSTV